MSTRPRLLDACCGAGGSAMGYHQAGFSVTGVDNVDQPNFPFEFICADALEVLADAEFVSRFDAVHASPPCQFYSAMSACRPRLAARYPDLIGPVRELLEATGLPYILENVEAARPWMKDPVMLCAQMFRPGVLLYRHRLFEAGGGLVLAAPSAPPDALPGKQRKCGWPHPLPASRAGHWEPGTAISVAGHVGNVKLAREVMEIGWTTREELAEAVPPYFAEYAAKLLLEHLRGRKEYLDISAGGPPRGRVPADRLAADV